MLVLIVHFILITSFLYCSSTWESVVDMNYRFYIQHKAFHLRSSFWIICPLFILSTPIIVTENIVFHVQQGWREAGGDSEGERWERKRMTLKRGGNGHFSGFFQATEVSLMLLYY